MPYNMDRLKARILEKYANQKTFADAIGVQESTLSRYLGGREWKSSALIKAVEVLEIPADEIESYFFEPAVSKRKPRAVK